MPKEILLSVKNLEKHFLVEKKLKKEDNIYVKAVDNVTFDVYRGETLGIVGESGCGKSTLGRAVLRLDDPTSGKIIFEGEDIVSYDKNKLRDLRKDMQFIFQDPYSSMNPKLTIKDIILEPIDNFSDNYTKEEKLDKVKKMLDVVGLSSDILTRYPHEFSGGQRQRIAIARGLMLNPKILVCDESVSALDVSVQAQVINLLKRLQVEFNLTYLFISHDLRVIKHISDRIVVLYLGQVVEITTSDELFNNPLHPYSQALIESISKGDPRDRMNRKILEGEIPSPLNAPKGCPFYSRCKKSISKCETQRPQLSSYGEEHMASCFCI